MATSDRTSLVTRRALILSWAQLAGLLALGASTLPVAAKEERIPAMGSRIEYGSQVFSSAADVCRKAFEGYPHYRLSAPTVKADTGEIRCNFVDTTNNNAPDNSGFGSVVLGNECLSLGQEPTASRGTEQNEGRLSDDCVQLGKLRGGKA